MKNNLGSTSHVSISYLSENTVLLEWPEKICSHQHQHIIYCQQQIYLALKNIVIDSVVSYASLIIYYKFDQLKHDKLNTILRHAITQSYSMLNFTENVSHRSINSTSNNPLVNNSPIKNECLTDLTTLNNVVEIPVYYAEDSGWDIRCVAQQIGATVAEVIQLHSQTIYRAYALGFTPGFCYLGELVPQLQLPRKSTPRLSVPKGSVAIAQQQTAVYPISSPGGWHIIGQTPIEMFQVSTSVNDNSDNLPNKKSNKKPNKKSNKKPNKEPNKKPDKNLKQELDQTFTSTIKLGQQVKFVPIDKTKFLALGGQLIEELT